MPYSLFLFDYDGTLCDSRQAIYHSLQQFFLTYHLPVPTLAEIAHVVERGLPTPLTMKALQPQAPADEIREWVVLYRALYAEQGEPLVVPFPGAQQVLAQVAARGLTPVVLSNKGIDVLEASLARFGLLEFVPLVIGDGSFPSQVLELKPSPMIYHQIIQPQFPAVPATDILMIGDTTADLQFARNCGIASCWASYGQGQVEECLALEPTHQISELRGVLALLG